MRRTYLLLAAGVATLSTETPLAQTYGDQGYGQNQYEQGGNGNWREQERMEEQREGYGRQNRGQYGDRDDDRRYRQQYRNPPGSQADNPANGFNQPTNPLAPNGIDNRPPYPLGQQPNYPRQGYQQPNYPQQGFPPPGYQEQSYPPQGYQQPNYPQQGFPPPGYQQQPYPPQGYQQQYDQQQGYPPPNQQQYDQQ